VDRNFIKTAIKNIRYEDINRLELQIAEDIISKFEQVRSVVRDSRKIFKQSNNLQIKNKIVEFERKK
jgi:hypothetical protein